jgi:hypothetical protein
VQGGGSTKHRVSNRVRTLAGVRETFGKFQSTLTLI